jgi:hypothetical protein
LDLGDLVLVILLGLIDLDFGFLDFTDLECLASRSALWGEKILSIFA